MTRVRLAVCLAVIFLSRNAGAQPVQPALSILGTSGNAVITFNWTADGSGNVPVASAPLGNQFQGYFVTQVETVLRTPAPIAGYSVAVNDNAGVDFLVGAGSNLSATLPQGFGTPCVAPPINGTVSLSISNQTNPGARGIVYVFIQQQCIPGSGAAATIGVSAGAPVNPCAAAGLLDINQLNGALYSCPTTDGSWVLASGGSGCTVGGGPNSVQVNNGSSGCTGNAGDTWDTSGTNGIQSRYGIKTGGANTASGGWNPQGLTSGSAGLGVNDVAGTPDILLLPTGIPTLNQVLTVTALGVGCGTDPLWTGRTCDQLGYSTSSGGGNFNPSDLTSVYWRDQLGNGANASNNCIFTFYGAGGNTGGATYSYQAVDLNHTPTCRATTGATSANDLSIFLNAGFTGTGMALSGLSSLSGSQTWEYVAVVRLPAITNVGAKVCLSTTPTDTSDTSANSICARFSTNAGDSTWKLVTCASSTCTTVDSTITVVANTWYKIRLDSSVSGTIGLTVNATTRVTSSSNIPSVALIPQLDLKTYTAASTNMDITPPLVFDATGLVKP